MTSRNFIGSLILVTLSDGSSVEGTLSHIDVASGTLRLERAKLHRDGYAEPVPVPAQSVKRSQVKDIQVLSLDTKQQDTRNTGAEEALIDLDVPEGNDSINTSIARRLPDAALPQPPQFSDPAILSFGRKAAAPPSTGSASSRNSRSAYLPNAEVSSPLSNGPAAYTSELETSKRPAPSSLASNSTVGKASVLSGAAPLASPHSQQSQQLGQAAPRPQVHRDRSSNQRINLAKKKAQQQSQIQSQYAGLAVPRRFGGAETAGSEADESHVANSEAPVIRRKGTNQSLRPRQQFVTSLQPDDTEAGETSDAGSSQRNGTFDDDFDFQTGLASFNKQAIFNEIRDADRTDPSHRLVAHNKKTAMQDKFTTKLKYNENVLDADETDNAPETHRYADYYTSTGDDTSLRPHDSITEGLGHSTDNETAISEDARPAYRFEAPSNGRRGPATAMMESATAQLSLQSLAKKKLLTTEGVKCPAITEKTWREIQQICNIESGPNIVQRIENGARGIASVVFKEMDKVRHVSASDEQPSVVILCTPCTKGGQGLRAGAHLVNHGVNVVAFVPPTETFPGNFDFHLRLFSSAGGKIARAIEDLPDHADIIIDALTDNESSSSAGGGQRRNKYDGACQEAASWSLSCTPSPRTDTKTPIISIDLPSNTDPDTGAVVPGAIWSITSATVVALGLIKAPSAMARYNLWLVDIGLPSTVIERASVKDYTRPFVGDCWITGVI